MLSNLPLSQHFDRSWYSHATVKATLYEAETQSQAAVALHAEQEVAPEIARIKACIPASPSPTIFLGAAVLH